VSLYLGDNSGALAVCAADPDSWHVRDLGISLPAPLVLARRADGRVLYAAHVGGVAAFRVEADGKLEFLAQVACNLSAPVAVAVSVDNAWLLVLDSCAIAVLPILADGMVVAEVSRVAVPARRAAALAMEPAGRFVLVADDAGHAVHVLRWDEPGHLAHHRRVPRPGDAPHGVAFHPDIGVVFLANEHGVSACHWHADMGHLTGAQALRPVPREYIGTNRVAGMVVSPDGRFLFVANSGHDSLATVAVQRRKGKMFLRRLDRMAPGVTALAQSPDGTMLLAIGATLEGLAVEGRYAMLSRRAPHGGNFRATTAG